MSPLIIGHSMSVLETSLTLHRIYGVPYLPATALKGLAAHYCHKVLGEKFDELRYGGKDFEILFGSTLSAGFIRFHDALPTVDSAGSALAQDVLTPHHHDYNSFRATTMSTTAKCPAPRDDDNSVPIPF
jgi:CRISPR-associated protein Cmr6